MSRLSNALILSRYKANKSQEFIAERLEVSRKTVQNWEKGTSEPTITQVFNWFHALGVNPVSFLFDFAYPTDFRGLGDKTDEEVDRAFEHLSDSLSKGDKLAILYLYTGEHGSSPSSIVQLMLAHLHNPLRDRIPIASNILTVYCMNKVKGDLICEEFPLPDEGRLSRSIHSAIESVVADGDGYMM